MIQRLLFIFFSLSPVVMFAQGYFYTESTVQINVGAFIEIKGQATIHQAISGDGFMVMNGDNAQSMGGLAANMHNLKITNNASVTLTDPLWVADTLNMESGNIFLEDENLYLADNSVHTGNNAGFLQTNGTGVVQRKLDLSPFTFHLGAGTEYFPITLTEMGTADTFFIQAWDFLPDDGTISGVGLVSHVALIGFSCSDLVPGGNNLNINMQWNDSKNAVDFVQPYAIGIWHNGTNYVELDNCPTNVNHINPNLVSYTGIDTVGTFGIGDSIYLTNIPAASINPGDTMVCQGTNVTFTAFPAGASNYLWNTMATTQLINTSVADTYYVDITDSTGCMYRSNEVTLTVLSLPATPSISQIGNLLSIAGGYASYQWYLDGNLLVGANDSSYTATGNGNYSVIVSGANGCTTSSTIYPFGSFGINETTGDLHIYQYQGQLMIELENDEPQQIYVYDALGKVVYQQKFSSAIIPLELSSGIYVVRVIGKLKEYTKKIIYP
jgi:hypothetical protein